MSCKQDSASASSDDSLLYFIAQNASKSCECCFILHVRRLHIVPFSLYLHAAIFFFLPLQLVVFHNRCSLMLGPNVQGRDATNQSWMSCGGDPLGLCIVWHTDSPLHLKLILIKLSISFYDGWQKNIYLPSRFVSDSDVTTNYSKNGLIAAGLVVWPIFTLFWCLSGCINAFLTPLLYLQW